MRIAACIRASLAAVMAAGTLGACGPDEVVSADFTITCTLVKGATGEGLSGRVVNFTSYKMDAGGSGIGSTVLHLSEDTRGVDGPPFADFFVGYNLHKSGEDEEAASFTCDYGPGSDGLSARESTSVSFSAAKAAGGNVMRTIALVAW